VQSHRPLQVRDCQGTLWAFYRQYEGKAALASFEGDLSTLDLNSLPGSSDQETIALKRQTAEPQLDFLVVPISLENVAVLKARLSRPGVLGLNGAVIHTQIEVAGEPILIACDNFHDECTVASRSVPVAFLEQLKEAGVLRGYSDD
jgi:hypothetical protein